MGVDGPPVNPDDEEEEEEDLMLGVLVLIEFNAVEIC